MTVTYLPFNKNRLGQIDLPDNWADSWDELVTVDPDGAILTPNDVLAPDGTVYGADGQPASSADTSAFFNQLIDAVQKGFTAYLTYDQASKLQNINLQRIQSGQQPLTNAQMQALRPGFSFGLAPDLQQMLIYGGIGLLAILLITGMKKGG